MKIRMDKTLRFWVDAPMRTLNPITETHQTSADRSNPTAIRTTRRRDALPRCEGKIALESDPAFLTMLADAERDAQDDLEDFP